MEKFLEAKYRETGTGNRSKTENRLKTGGVVDHWPDIPFINSRASVSTKESNITIL